MPIFKSSLLLLVLLGCFSSSVNGIKCGTPLTTDCLGSTDIRYNPEASNNLVDQAVIWEKQEGLFIGEGTGRINLVPFGHVPAAPDPSVFLISIPYFIFVNRTISGSRLYETTYTIAPLDGTNPVSRLSVFSTTTYEKDGTLAPLHATVLDSDVNTSAPAIPSALRTYPVDENTAYETFETTFEGMGGITSVLRVCLDVDCNRYDRSYNGYSIANGTVIRVLTSEDTSRRVATAEEWYAAIFTRYNESNVPLNERLDPRADVCDLGLCPTEEQWCETDPDCSESPYQEPPASVRGGVIAGFTIAGVVILVAVLYLVHRNLLARQAQRYRTVFAKRIANTIEVRGSMRALPPQALVEEFNRIDAGVKDGKLSREEMWEFISSGKAGEIDRKDFDALFAAIDVDGSGNIDFLEFCAFMSKCHDEYRAARVDRGSIVARSVYAASTAFVKVPEDEEDVDA